jgi:microcystin degradation protein MlrC
LEIAPERPAIVPVVDPIAAQMACDAGAGKRLIIRLGHQVDPQWGEPINVEGVVSRLSDGIFTYRGGIWDGRSGCMGPSAVFEIGPIQVLISSNATYDWKTEQLDLLGLNIPESKFIVVKNPMNYQQAYAEVMKAALILDTPGPTPVNTNSLTYTKMNSQWFPRNWTMMNTKPVVMSSTARYSRS